MTLHRAIHTPEQIKLFKRAMTELDSQYDVHMRLIGSGQHGETEHERHSSRDSIHYALGLLLRNDKDDIQKACDIIDQVLQLQLTDEDEIYYGTFLTSPQAARPPKSQFPWGHYREGVMYYVQHTFDRFQEEWLKLEQHAELTYDERQKLRQQLTSVFESVVPPVWKSYDPNWREFIASTFAIMLELCENLLPASLVQSIDEAMKRTVQGSINRKLSDDTPMNTNVELMHYYVVDYYADRYQQPDWKHYILAQLQSFQAELNEHGTFAEFNSATYYGVDLTVLGLMRQYSKLPEAREFAVTVEKQLWHMIGQFYNSSLNNLAGPYSRAYEMYIPDHSSMGAFLYLALGERYEFLAPNNCETAHYILIAILDIQLSDELKQMITTEPQPHQVEATYRELCERHEPGARRYDCRATAWIEPNLMLGGLSGSHNSSGQLHPATIHWQTTEGKSYYVRLLRREPKGHWSTHYFGVLFDAVVREHTLEVEVKLSMDHHLEVFLEIAGDDLQQASFTDGVWQLPGLRLTLEDQGLPYRIHPSDQKIEHIYTYDYTKGPQTMKLKLHAELA